MGSYLTAANFSGDGVVPYLSAVVKAIPPFFGILFIMFWLVINGAAYFATMKLTGRKTFWLTFISSSFVFFLMSLVMAVMNGINSIEFMSGYWVAFYLLMTILGWYLLENYK